jgi:hypothetical protein
MFRTRTVSSIFLATVVFAGNAARAQCTTQPIPTAPVEVAVPCTGSGCEFCRQGRFPTLRIDGCSRVLVAWEDIPQGTTTQPVQNNIRFMRFDADGTPLPYDNGDCGSPLSTGGRCNQKGPDTTNFRVSLAAGPAPDLPLFAMWTARYSEDQPTVEAGFFLSKHWLLGTTQAPNPTGPPAPPGCQGRGASKSSRPASAPTSRNRSTRQQATLLWEAAYY